MFVSPGIQCKPVRQHIPFPDKITLTPSFWQKRARIARKSPQLRPWMLERKLVSAKTQGCQALWLSAWDADLAGDSGWQETRGHTDILCGVSPPLILFLMVWWSGKVRQASTSIRFSLLCGQKLFPGVSEKTKVTSRETSYTLWARMSREVPVVINPKMLTIFFLIFCQLTVRVCCGSPKWGVGTEWPGSRCGVTRRETVKCWLAIP